MDDRIRTVVTPFRPRFSSRMEGGRIVQVDMTREPRVISISPCAYGRYRRAVSVRELGPNNTQRVITTITIHETIEDAENG